MTHEETIVFHITVKQLRLKFGRVIIPQTDLPNRQAGEWEKVLYVGGKRSIH